MAFTQQLDLKMGNGHYRQLDDSLYWDIDD